MSKDGRDLSPTLDRERTELEALEAQRDEAIEAVRVERALEKQRTVLLPQLELRRDGLTAKIDPLFEQRNRIDKAIHDINAGKITDYRMRKPRKAKGEKATD